MKTKPNILAFVVDQMQAYTLSCHGHPDVRTPHLDKLAEQGCTFTRAYCNNPVCMPSRASLLTGLTPRQHGCLTNGNKLSEEVPTLPQALIRHGYRTHAIGKLHHQPFGAAGAPGEPEFSWESRKLWNNGEIEGLPDNYYGFQTTEYVGGHVTCYGDYLRWLEAESPGMGAKLSEAGAYYKGAPMSWRLDMPEELHYNRWIADRAKVFLEDAAQGGPFYLWCSFPDPHFPFSACRPYSEMYDPGQLTLPDNWQNREDPLPWLAKMRQVHGKLSRFDEAELREILAQTYGMITHLDDCIGDVLGRLEDLGLDDNTIIVFLADHGEYLGGHQLITKAEWPWEELLKVPYIWKVPGAARTGVQSRDVVSLLDYVPTLLDLAGLPQSELDARGVRSAEPLGLPGRSLRPFLERGEPLEHKPALVEYDEDWHPPRMCRMRALVGERYKLTMYMDAKEGLLTDLQEDPLEAVNLWPDPRFAEVRMDMTEQLLMELIRTDRLDTRRITGA